MEEDLKKLFGSLKNINISQNLNDPENENVLKLAYIGDTIFDLFTRYFLLTKYADKIKMNELHKKNSNLVCAKSQARIVERLIDDNLLSDTEIAYYKHARNAHSRSKSKNSSIIDYRKATGFEAILGLLLIRDDIDRLIQVLNDVKNILEE